jgi:hypothetical protein
LTNHSFFDMQPIFKLLVAHLQIAKLYGKYSDAFSNLQSERNANAISTNNLTKKSPKDRFNCPRFS